MRFFRTDPTAPYYNESRMPRTREPMTGAPNEEKGNCRGETSGYRPSTRDVNRAAAINEDALMRKIQELSFMTVELELYLDAYPDSSSALEAYRRTSAELASLTRQYEEHFGPLIARNAHADQWTWTMGKWPWHTDDWR